MPFTPAAPVKAKARGPQVEQELNVFEFTGLNINLGVESEGSSKVRYPPPSLSLRARLRRTP